MTPVTFAECTSKRLGAPDSRIAIAGRTPDMKSITPGSGIAKAAVDAMFDDSVNVDYWARLEDGRIECRLCPRFCKMRAGQRGLCFVRRARDDGEGMELTGYGRSTGFCVDPIEKKPLNHFLPGSSVLSFGTAGCNLACSFCQNHDISKSREVARLSSRAAPETIARAAEHLGCASVAYTYNDPVIFMEYALDTAEACRARGVKNVAVTAGFICEEPRKRFFAGMDAANVDLKGFTERFYEKRCAGSLGPVLETLKYLVHETEVWTEITTLLIPGENDSEEEIEALSAWVLRELGSDVPLHFTAFHPDYRMLETPRTPSATLQKARCIALRAGLHHVYIGNVEDPSRQATLCATCGLRAVGRDGYKVTTYELDTDGTCKGCGTKLAGVFAERPGNWGARRLAVEIEPYAAA
jgi:pyruvate formate lyase activating enzyme